MPSTTVPRQTDRDLLIKVDNDVKHLTNSMNDVKSSQERQGVDMTELKEALLHQTHNIGAITRGLEKAEEMMHSVGRHDQRIGSLEETVKKAHNRVDFCDTERDALKVRVTVLETENLVKKRMIKLLLWLGGATWTGIIAVAGLVLKAHGLG